MKKKFSNTLIVHDYIIQSDALNGTTWANLKYHGSTWQKTWTAFSSLGLKIIVYMLGLKIWFHTIGLFINTLNTNTPRLCQYTNWFWEVIQRHPIRTWPSFQVLETHAVETPVYSSFSVFKYHLKVSQRVVFT